MKAESSGTVILNVISKKTFIHSKKEIEAKERIK